MPNLALEHTTDLAFKARQGDRKAGKALIEECRRGMVKPDWETRPRITQELIDAHLARRTKKGSGRMFV